MEGGVRGGEGEGEGVGVGVGFAVEDEEVWLMEEA